MPTPPPSVLKRRTRRWAGGSRAENGIAEEQKPPADGERVWGAAVRPDQEGGREGGQIAGRGRAYLLEHLNS